MPAFLEISTAQKEGVLQVAKSRKIPVLLGAEEMETLLDHLEPLWIFDVSRPLALDAAAIPKGQFLGAYRGYVETLAGGQLAQEGPLRPYFSTVFTCDDRCVYAQRVEGNRFLIRAKTPCIQLQRHHFIYSGDFHSGVMGAGSITWGIQFSYPHLYIDPKTRAIGKVEKDPRFPNTMPFGRLAKWIRSQTRPTPFVIDGKRVNQPIRLGLSCFSWIHRHPGLIQRGLRVLA